MTKRLKQIIRRLTDEILLAAILGLCGAAALAVALDPLLTRTQPAEEFQRLVRGLGLGCQADLARCAWQFDPRLMGDEDGPLDVVAGSHLSNPWHSLSLFPEPGEFGDAGQQD